ncbi:MAG: DUF423 domain-containing protein [Comamonas sp.]|nr:DUF423 domain-containing protein [Comamonas sp.]
MSASHHARWVIVLAALFGLSGVALAAYTSHGLGFITDPALREATRASMQQAVQQQMLHAPVLLALGLWASTPAAAKAGRWLALAAGFFALGLLLFSGLIYLRGLTGFSSLAALVPWGGTCLMLGWLFTAVIGWRYSR